MSADISVRVDGDTEVSARYTPPSVIKLKTGDLPTSAVLAVEVAAGDVRLSVRGTPDNVLSAITAAVAAAEAEVAEVTG